MTVGQGSHAVPCGGGVCLPMRRKNAEWGKRGVCGESVLGGRRSRVVPSHEGGPSSKQTTVTFYSDSFQYSRLS